MLCGCRAFAFGRRRDGFDLLPIQARGFTSAGHRQVQLELVWRSRYRHETSDLFTLSFNPFSGTVRAFGQRAGLLCPLLTSAPRSGRLTTPSVPKDTMQISRSKPDSLHRTPAGFTVLALMDMDFATSCPLVRPALPRIRFLFVGSRLCSTLPSDGPSRFRPCALLVLHLHQVAQGTFTPCVSDMSDTHRDRGASRG